jgi:hypothetical protein
MSLPFVTTVEGFSSQCCNLEEGRMFSLVKNLGVQVALKQEAVPFLAAFLIAEFLFKFKSFTLECLAFLASWFVLSFLQSLIFPAWRGQRPNP